MPKGSELDRSSSIAHVWDPHSLHDWGDTSLGDSVSGFYESEWLGELIGEVRHPGGDRLIQAIGKRCIINEESEVLDVGCGDGVTTIGIASSFGCTIRGLDISQELVDEAREKVNRGGLENVNFQLTNGDISHLPESSYDVILFISSLSLFESKLDVLREARRILKPGGILVVANIIVTENLPLEGSTKMMFASCIAGALPKDSMADLIEEVGFKEVTTIDWSHELKRQWATAFMRVQLKRRPKNSSLKRTGEQEGGEVRKFLQNAEELFDSGALGYCIFIGKG